MNSKSSVKNLVFTALCVALGVVLPQVLHGIPQAGQILLPMHIPVLLCGLLCGWMWGLACGLLTPLLSSLFFSMPPAPMLPGMLLELAVYGLAAGLLYRALKANLYVSLVCAMLAGRVAYGVMNAIIFLAGGNEYSFKIFFAGLFVKGLPGIFIQLVFLPLVVWALEKSGVVQKPSRKVAS